MTNTTENEVTSDDLAGGTSDQSEIAALAYSLWQDRGCPIGSPDEDWFQADEGISRPACNSRKGWRIVAYCANSWERDDGR